MCDLILLNVIVDAVAVLRVSLVMLRKTAVRQSHAAAIARSRCPHGPDLEHTTPSGCISLKFECQIATATFPCGSQNDVAARHGPWVSLHMALDRAYIVPTINHSRNNT